ncbi:MAG: CBS domain-containing protein [Candidatus Latescibacteria bacterium]|nr:CBS domain-containing protein [Candidatus Latescibacterota bacterium]
MNLRHSLHSDTVKHVDLSFYVEVEKGNKVDHVISKMQANQRKCALVMDRGQLMGIFTAHDIARRVIDQPGVANQSIEEIMTSDPLTLNSDVKLIEAIQFMGDKPHRYMPVVDAEGRVLGTLTHYAIIKYMSDHFPEEIYNLPPTPDHFASARDGA